MNLILSTPTSRGGGSLLTPSWGTAHIAVDGRVVLDFILFGATIETLSELRVEGLPLEDAEVWFEDDREISH